MLSGDYTRFLDEQGYCTLSFRAYTVNHASTGRTFTRTANLDIPTEFIDVNSIRYEAALSSNLYLEPGGVVPVIIKCRVYGAILDENGMHEIGSQGGVVRGYTETPEPGSTNHYDTAFLPVITMHRGISTTQTVVIASHMIITDAVRNVDGSYDLTFQDERIVLDRNEIDMTYQTTSFKTVAQNAFAFAGFTGATFSDGGNCYPGSNGSGTTEIMTSRQVISYIMQLSGCFLRGRRGVFSPVPLLSVSLDEDNHPIPHLTLSSDWVFETTNIKNILGQGRINNIYVYENGADTPQRKNKNSYTCRDNPFITSGNKSAIKTLLQDRLNFFADNNGIIIDCLFYPLLEPGDFLKYNGHIFVLSRIEWEGGLFCKLYGTDMNKEYA